jgi:hypothetical protein
MNPWLVREPDGREDGADSSSTSPDCPQRPVDGLESAPGEREGGAECEETDQ